MLWHPAGYGKYNMPVEFPDRLDAGRAKAKGGGIKRIRAAEKPNEPKTREIPGLSRVYWREGTQREWPGSERTQDPQDSFVVRTGPNEPAAEEAHRRHRPPSPVVRPQPRNAARLCRHGPAIIARPEDRRARR
jgi:hypothetical protein